MSKAEPDRMIFDSKLKAERDYLINKLSHEMGISNLRLDFQRPPYYSPTKETIEVRLPEDVRGNVVKITGDSAFLTYAVLVAALKACLRKYTGSDTIAIGSPSRDAGDELDEPLNALVIVDEVSDQMSFRQLLYKVRETLLESYSMQSYPFESLVRDLELEGTKNKCLLFDIAVLLNGYHRALPEVMNDITIEFFKSSSAIAGKIRYNANLFHRNTIERFGGHLVTLLRAALEKVDAPIGDLEMLPEAERRQLLFEWNTRIDFQDSRCAHELFESQAEQAPDATAMIFEEEHLTYGELNCRANKLAHYLRLAGVGPEVLAAICLERSQDMIVAVLGVLKAGGAYLPLDPEYPRQRLAFMMNDSCAKILLTHKHLLEGVPECDARVICLDSQWEDIAGERAENPVSIAAQENLAYVIYTSGSTGRPKGVMIEHKGVCNLANAQIKAFNITRNSHVLQFASLSFDASVSEIFTALTCGATLRLQRYEVLQSGTNLIDVLRDLEVTTVTLPPAMLTIMPALELPALDTMIVAGESCAEGLVTIWSMGRNFINAYGPTEVTVCASLMNCDGWFTGNPPIGRPIDNTRIYLLDAGLKPVPICADGELHVAGVGLARGYLNHPELTSQRFIPNPFGDELASRLYKTGDLARYLPDGNIEFSGRIDRQVKIRGFRIELEEVEAALNQHPDLRNVVIRVKEDLPGDKRLVAYVVPNLERTLDANLLRSFLLERLPEYMVPSIFILLDEMPLTPNGKPDEGRLSAQTPVRPQSAGEVVGPRTPTEELMIEIWRSLLGVERISIYDNFFELGGHSLLATQLSLRVRENFQVELPIEDLFRLPTMADLAEHIDTILWTTQGMQAAKRDADSAREEGDL